MSNTQKGMLIAVAVGVLVGWIISMTLIVKEVNHTLHELEFRLEQQVHYD